MVEEDKIHSEDTAGEPGGAGVGVLRLAIAAVAIVVFLAALGLLWWNEGAGRGSDPRLDEVAAQAQAAKAHVVDPQLDGQLVYLSGSVRSQAGARDSVFAVATDGVGLYRQVLIYQWIERQAADGGVRYELGWDSRIHDSTRFQQPAGHENPKPDLTSAAFFAEDARFGPYRFDNREVLELALAQIDRAATEGGLGGWPKVVATLPDPHWSLTAKGWFKHQPDHYYRGTASAQNPNVGDLNVRFYAFANDQSLTLAAMPRGQYLAAWTPSSGEPVFLAAAGEVGIGELVQQARIGDAPGPSLTLRLAGVGVAALGAAASVALITGLLSVLPLIGTIATYSLPAAGGVFGALAGLLTIAVGQYVPQPWISAVVMLVLAIITALLAYILRGCRPLARAAAKVEVEVSRPIVPVKPIEPILPPPVTQPAVVDESKELPPLEWTPGLISVKAESLRRAAAASSAASPRSDAAPKAASAPVPKTASPAPTRAPAEPAKPAPAVTPKPQPAATAKPVAPAAPAAGTGVPGFETVAPREAMPPLFDSVPQREIEPPLLDSVPMREPETALQFDLAPTRAPEAPAPAPAAAAAAAPTAAAAPAAGSAQNLRVMLGSKGDYTINKLVRQHADGRQDVLAFELTLRGKPVKRGTQDEVKEALRQALAGNHGA